MTQRVLFGDVKPFDVPADLDELRGPVGTMVEVLLWVIWSPNPRAMDLANPAVERMVYGAAVVEGTVEIQRSLLNSDRLVALWDDLVLPQRVRTGWEERFPLLASTDAYDKNDDPP